MDECWSYTQKTSLHIWLSFGVSASPTSSHRKCHGKGFFILARWCNKSELLFRTGRMDYRSWIDWTGKWNQTDVISRCQRFTFNFGWQRQASVRPSSILLRLGLLVRCISEGILQGYSIVMACMIVRCAFRQLDLLVLVIDVSGSIVTDSLSFRSCKFTRRKGTFLWNQLFNDNYDAMQVWKNGECALICSWFHSTQSSLTRNVDPDDRISGFRYVRFPGTKV